MIDRIDDERTLADLGVTDVFHAPTGRRRADANGVCDQGDSRPLLAVERDGDSARYYVGNTHTGESEITSWDDPECTWTIGDYHGDESDFDRFAKFLAATVNQ